jgi:hypothetical protein
MGGASPILRSSMSKLRCLSPRARVGLSLLAIGMAHFFARRFDDAVPKLLLAIQEDPSHPSAYHFLAASCAHMSRLDDAREIVTRLRAITSVVIPDASQHRIPTAASYWSPACAWPGMSRPPFAAILATDVAGCSRLMGAAKNARSNASKRCAAISPVVPSPVSSSPAKWRAARGERSGHEIPIGPVFCGPATLPSFAGHQCRNHDEHTDRRNLRKTPIV